jgi:hypothetical protein
VDQFLLTLLDRGAKIHQPGPDGVRPLNLAIKRGLEPAVVAMVRKYPPRDHLFVSTNACYLHQAVAFSASREPSEKIIDALIASGSSLTEIDLHGDTPLSYMLRCLCKERRYTWGYHRFIKPLLGPGVDVHRKNDEGSSIVDYLEDLLRSQGKGHDRGGFLARHIQLVGVDGARRIRFLPKTRKGPKGPKKGSHHHGLFTR